MQIETFNWKNCILFSHKPVLIEIIQLFYELQPTLVCYLISCFSEDSEEIKLKKQNKPKKSLLFRVVS